MGPGDQEEALQGGSSPRAFEALKTAPAWLVKAREPVSRLRSWRLGAGPARVWGGGLQRHGMDLSFLPVSWGPVPLRVTAVGSSGSAGGPHQVYQ